MEELYRYLAIFIMISWFIMMLTVVIIVGKRLLKCLCPDVDEPLDPMEVAKRLDGMNTEEKARYILELVNHGYIRRAK